MAIKIGNYTFDGPYSSTESLENRSGIYVILCSGKSEYRVIDIGESSELKTRLENHDRKDCWQKNCKTGLYVAVYYTPSLHQAGRKEVEQELRNFYNPVCGER